MEKGLPNLYCGFQELNWTTSKDRSSLSSSGWEATLSGNVFFRSKDERAYGRPLLGNNNISTSFLDNELIKDKAKVSAR